MATTRRHSGGVHYGFLDDRSNGSNPSLPILQRTRDRWSLVGDDLLRVFDPDVRDSHVETFSSHPIAKALSKQQFVRRRSRSRTVVFLEDSRMDRITPSCLLLVRDSLLAILWIRCPTVLSTTMNRITFIALLSCLLSAGVGCKMSAPIYTWQAAMVPRPGPVKVAVGPVGIASRTTNKRFAQCRPPRSCIETAVRSAIN